VCALESSAGGLMAGWAVGQIKMVVGGALGLVGSRARYRYCSSSDHFRKSLVFLIFLLKFCKSFGNLSCNKV
jgi:hypothetical protein